MDKHNPIIAIKALGQSTWCDNIHQAMLASGELQRLVGTGLQRLLEQLA